jgi:hypothetical protein
MSRFSAVVFVALLVTPPVVGADAGVVKGTFAVGGKTYTPDHIYAISAPNVFDKTKDDVRVIFSIGPQKEGLILHLGEGASNSVTVDIGPGTKAEPEIRFLYANGNLPVDIGEARPMMAPFSWSGLPGVTFVKKDFRPGASGRISGKLTIPQDPRNTSDPIVSKSALTADLEFDVPVIGRVEK